MELYLHTAICLHGLMLSEGPGQLIPFLSFYSSAVIGIGYCVLLFFFLFFSMFIFNTFAPLPSRHSRMPREGMLKISAFCLPHVTRNVP
jgi:hypothetical protein